MAWDTCQSENAPVYTDEVLNSASYSQCSADVLEWPECIPGEDEWDRDEICVPPEYLCSPCAIADIAIADCAVADNTECDSIDYCDTGTDWAPCEAA